MSEACAASVPVPEPAHVVLKGTARGLEIQVAGSPTTPALAARLEELLAEAPAFFAGCDARVALLDDGELGPDAAGVLAEVASRFALQIVEIAPRAERRLSPVPFAEGSGRIGPDPQQAAPDQHPYIAMSIEHAHTAVSDEPYAAWPAEPAGIVAPPAPPPPVVAAPEPAPIGPRLLVGPVRSGVVVEHPGHLIIVGDVNPGAEIRAEGSILVLGRLRGVAHAAIGGTGCIIALSLQPQQLRIGRLLARAADKDRPSGGAEIAYVAADVIVVERFQGRLPSGLAASM